MLRLVTLVAAAHSALAGQATPLPEAVIREKALAAIMAAFVADAAAMPL